MTDGRTQRAASARTAFYEEDRKPQAKDDVGTTKITKGSKVLLWVAFRSSSGRRANRFPQIIARGRQMRMSRNESSLENRHSALEQ